MTASPKYFFQISLVYDREGLVLGKYTIMSLCPSSAKLCKGMGNGCLHRHR